MEWKHWNGKYWKRNPYVSHKTFFFFLHSYEVVFPTIFTKQYFRKLEQCSANEVWKERRKPNFNPITSLSGKHRPSSIQKAKCLKYRECWCHSQTGDLVRKRITWQNNYNCFEIELMKCSWLCGMISNDYIKVKKR